MKPGNAGGGKGPQLKGNARSNEDGGIDVSLTTPASVQKLQMALHDKAKESPDLRFYALYDKVYRKDVLAFAYERCKAMAEQQESTAKPSRTSRRTGWNDGWTNWRKS